METKIIYAIVAIALLSGYGCSTVRIIDTSHNTANSLHNYKTFSFYDVDINNPTDVSYTNRIGWIKEEITKQMHALGIEPTKTNPDVKINIGIVVEEKTQTRTTDFRTDAPKYIGQRNYTWKSEEIETGRYKEGTFTVDLVDSKLNTIVWYAKAASVLSDKDEKAHANIIKGVAKIFDKMKSK